MLIALVSGRVLSIVRIALMDSTFGVALPFIDCRQAPYRGAIMSVEPDYRQLIDSGRREAFILAIASEQRPYQFAGNTAIGARASHYRFMRAIAAVNGQDVRSVDREGRPCQTGVKSALNSSQNGGTIDAPN